MVYLNYPHVTQDSDLFFDNDETQDSLPCARFTLGLKVVGTFIENRGINTEGYY